MTSQNRYLRGPIRVLIVDDSATMRRLIQAALVTDERIEIIGEAVDASSARDMIDALKPDVVTLDIELPGMNGLEFLSRIMKFRPLPVIMVSSLTQRGAEASVEALAIGAFECVAKPNAASNHSPFAKLPEIICAASRANVVPKAKPQSENESWEAFEANKRIVAIGASTGGVEALTTILAGFPKNCPPTLITQHMPAGFTENFADRLNRVCAPKIKQAEQGDRLRPGTVYLAPGGDNHLVLDISPELHCSLQSGEKVAGHRPSVDVLFQSCVPLKSQAVGVLLTGMGKDGAAGLLGMRRAGAVTIGQDEGSCVVYGMPREAAAIGALTRQVSLRRIRSEILKVCNRLDHQNMQVARHTQ